VQILDQALTAMSAIASRSILRASSRSILRTRAPLCSSAKLAQNNFRPQSFTPAKQSIRAFSSTMPTMVEKSVGDAVASPAPKAEFDHEIVDMANYIHNYEIKSDLAVSFGKTFPDR